MYYPRATINCYAFCNTPHHVKLSSVTIEVSYMHSCSASQAHSKLFSQEM